MVTNSASGFMGIGGKYFTDRFGQHHIGEHQFDFKDNKLNGRGIRIYPDGDIRIGYFDKGLAAPGSFI